MRRKIISVFLLFCALLGLAACGRQSMKQKNADGTVTMIEYRSAAPLERAPYFERSETALCMTFNGITWYEASIVDREIAAWAGKGKPVAQSRNIRMVEADPHAGYAYAYIMTLNGTDEAYILFYTDDLPGETYGSDFTTSIRYFTDSTETVPDLEFVMTGE